MTSLMRVLGVDPGARRIGLALSDEDGCFASPHATLPGGALEASARSISDAARALQAERIVVGWPLSLDGTEGEAARKARLLSERVRELSGLPVVLWDERLTSRAAERELRASGMSRERRRAATDRVAAALLLQSYLDAERARDGQAD
jgi:putative Holliday junction resolvase